MFFGILGSIIMSAAIIAVIMLIVKKGKTKCKKCKTKYVLDTDVEWNNLGNVSTAKGTNAKIEFRCKCHKCGEERTFTKEFRKQYVDGNDKVINLNVENAIKEFFK